MVDMVDMVDMVGGMKSPKMMFQNSLEIPS